MKLSDFLREENIIEDLKAREKQELLVEMVMDVASRDGSLASEDVLKSLVDREKLGSTGIGHGVAVPHGKVKGISEIKVFFGRSRRGVNFNSMDRQPVYLFFLIIAPENSAAAHLKVLASISHLLKNQDLRGRLMRAADSSEIYRVIKDAERKGGLF